MVVQPTGGHSGGESGRATVEADRIILEIEARLHKLIESSRMEAGASAQTSVLAAAAESCAERRRL
ncbi:MAG: hypothetical protein QOJ27_2663, partial [Sphingomonadales bacterium]|nr:hypothetical protein [Sphingomonadales bacterium]